MKRIMFLLSIAAALCASARVLTFTPASGDMVTVGGAGGKIVAVEAFSPSTSGGSVALSSVWSGDVYTNGSATVTTTNYTYGAVYSNTVSHAVYTNTYAALPVPAQIYCNTLGVITNDVVTVVTNTWSGYKETVVQTNSIVTGTASGKVFSASPQSDTYVGGTDRLLFTGTGAASGFLRIVVD